MIDLSIVIVNFNTKDLVVDCFKSIKGDGSAITLEVIIVDNGSTDGSVEIFRKLQVGNKDFHLIENLYNLGYAKANNQGAKIAKGKYLLLLNSDTKIQKNTLGNLVNFAQKNPDVGVVGPKLLNADGSTQPSCYHFPSIKNAILTYWFKQNLLEKFAPKGNSPVEVDAVVGAVFLITPQALRRVGLLDERYWAYFEDVDYCRQVHIKGLKVYYLPTAEVVHYHGVSFKKANPDDKTRWHTLIPSSKIYHGVAYHYLLNSIIWLGQKWQKLFG